MTHKPAINPFRFDLIHWLFAVAAATAFAAGPAWAEEAPATPAETPSTEKPMPPVLDTPSPAAAPEPTVGVAVKGQYRPRYETNSKALGGETTDFNVSHRARINLDLTYDRWKIGLAPQHVLGWGSETNSVAKSSGDFDFHEAYMQGPVGKNSSFKIGRQEIAFDDQRIIGSLGWAQQGRSFNGIRVHLKGDEAAPNGDLFLTYLTEGGDADKMLAGGHAEGKLGNTKLSGMTLIDFLDKPGSVRATLGPRLLLKTDSLLLDLAGYVQLGNADPGDISTLAGMAALRVGYIGSSLGSLTVGFDYLSGDDDTTDSDNHTFDTLFATNHKFYGYMDYFLNIPVHTGGLGLSDAVIEFKTTKIPKVATTLAAHYLMASVDSAAGNRDFGTEIDLVLAYPANKFFKLVGGYSTFIAGDAMVDIGRASASGDVGHWLWIMATMNLGFTADG